ncbi:MAG: hypothetical protein EBR20_03940, partial [Bacteroidetes bacterium]|nr:hypothetical protein [Bacteroidota bacterium]
QAASECQTGVAVVETRLSFINQVASMVTFGLYTPMHIKVTCAASSMSSASESNARITIERSASAETLVDAFTAAADKAVATAQPVFVDIR